MTNGGKEKNGGKRGQIKKYLRSPQALRLLICVLGSALLMGIFEVSAKRGKIQLRNIGKAGADAGGFTVLLDFSVGGVKVGAGISRQRGQKGYTLRRVIFSVTNENKIVLKGGGNAVFVQRI